MILVCGEALIDLFAQAGDGASLKALVGGSPFNVSRGLARLGISTGFLGGVSTDAFGSLLADSMRDAGIDTSLLKRSARPTPLALVTNDQQGHPTYTFYAQESAAQDVTSSDIPDRLPQSITALAFGSYLLAVEPVATALLGLARRETLRSTIALDCNLRPALVGSVHQWRERIDQFARYASIIKLSDEDFALGWPREVAIDDLVGRWLARGAQLVVMTHGAYGSTAWHRSGRVAVAGLRVAVVDTVGAGDSFQAGLLARLAQQGALTRKALASLDGAAIRDALRYANVTAGLTCRQRGANVPRRAEVDAVMIESTTFEHPDGDT